jgi:hypothetical protein
MIPEVYHNDKIHDQIFNIKHNTIYSKRHAFILPRIETWLEDADESPCQI